MQGEYVNQMHVPYNLPIYTPNLPPAYVESQMGYHMNEFISQSNQQFIQIPAPQNQYNQSAPIYRHKDHIPPKSSDDPTISNDDNMTQADILLRQVAESGKDFASFLNEVCQKCNLKPEYSYHNDINSK